LKSNGTVKNYQKVSNLIGGLNSTISQDALFGESIDGVVDIDGDGKIEIVVGAMKLINPTLSIPTGAFFIIELNSDGTVSEEHLYTFAENCFSGLLNNGDLFGGSITVLSNNSFAIGAYRDSENGYRKGAVWILDLGVITYNLNLVTNPTGCGSADGFFAITGLTSGSNYTVSYIFESLTVTENYIADTNGEILVSGLGAGTYEAILVTEDLTGCSDDLGQIVLVSPDLVLTIASLSPTSCGSADGSFAITGLTSGSNYSVNYLFESSTVIRSYIADLNGEVLISGLSAGTYDAIIVTEDLTGCSNDLGQIILTSPDLLPIIASLSPTSCGSADGSIVISGLTSGSNYSISYIFESLTVMGNYLADTNGEVLISGLDVGTYDAIIATEDMTGCSGDLGRVDLTLPEFNPTISTINPISCMSMDGTITIAGLTAGSNYTISYVYESLTEIVNKSSDLNGEITILGLDSGVYDSIIITDDTSGCLDSLGYIELTCFELEFNCFKTKPFFTPNNDGYNDFWSLELISNECNYSLYIFDRYGKLLKTLTPQSNEWDGTYRGVEMPYNDYWYMVNYIEEGKNLEYKSHFTLKR